MRDLEQSIRPGVGLGCLLLGTSRRDVRALLGEPINKREAREIDGVITHTWDYEWLGIQLIFQSDDSYRLGSIKTSYEWATLGNSRIVGLSESELLGHDFEGLGPPVLEDDLEEAGRVYGWYDLNLSCWVDADEDRECSVVTSVTIMPLYDRTGNVPQWPSGVE